MHAHAHASWVVCYNKDFYLQYVGNREKFFQGNAYDM